MLDQYMMDLRAIWCNLHMHCDAFLITRIEFNHRFQDDVHGYWEDASHQDHGKQCRLS